MKLSRTASYAVQATLQLARAPLDHPTPCNRLATDGHMPERFLTQILRNLVCHGILDSSRGIEGGYSLHRRPEEISLLEVIEAVEGPLAADLPIGPGLPAGSQQRLRTAIDRVTTATRNQLDGVKLSQLLEPRVAASATVSFPP